jgi:selenocysteine-specific elongation factor
LSRLARQAQSRGAERHFRLPVDRSFVMPGFGTVVTGTVSAGAVHIDEELQAHPGSAKFRVRGIQVHNESVTRAFAGQRAALNLAGIDHSDLRRGMTLAPKNVFAPATILDAAVELLPAAKALKDGAPVHFHTGTVEVQAEIRTLDHTAIESGSTALARIVLREPVLALPGDRFIIRMFSPVTTIGGGEVLDCSPPRRAPRSALLGRAQKLFGADLAGRIEVFLSEAPEGMSTADLIRRTGALTESLLRARPPRIHLFGEWWIHDEFVRSKIASWMNQLDAFHRSYPLLAGLSKEEVRSRGLRSAPPSVFEAMLALDKQIVASGELIRLATHKVTLQADEQQASARIASAFETAGLRVPSAPEVLNASGVDPGRARSLLQLLIKEGRLVRVSDELVFHADAIESMKHLLAGRKGQSFTVADFKDWTGISRKYAIPLLEWLDRERISRRVGDARIVL